MMGTITACVEGIRRQRAAAAEREWSRHPSAESDGTPSWDELRLDARDLARGTLVEIVVDRDGAEAGRCLARRDGTFLREPTGPSWVRRMLVEAVAEWRLAAA
jgi:hypothetical protein